MAIILRDGSEVDDPRLGRVVEFDPLSLSEHPITDVLTAAQVADPVTKLWQVGIPSPLDQGREGACVGYAFTHELMAEPVAVGGLSNAYALGAYRRAQNLDNFPNSQPGTSVLAGAKTMKERGWYTRYTWCETEEEVAAAVSHVGPVVVGTNWHQDMYTVPRDGFVTATGRVVGGHCWLLVGLNVEGGYYDWINSWGLKYGKRGRAKIRREEFTKLWNRRGEGCVPIRTAKTSI